MKLKRFLKWVAGIAIIAILFVIGLGILMLEGFRVKMPECNSGPLTKIEKCKKDHSAYTWMSSGWWYSDAEGSLRSSICDKIKQGAQEIEIDNIRKEKVIKVQCQSLGLTDERICYASQRFASNGNSRFMHALILDSECKARYFAGSKVTLTKGNPAKVTGFGEPYPGIPEVK